MTESPETNRILAELQRVDFDDLSARSKSIYLINCAWPYQYAKIKRKAKLRQVEQFTDSAMFYAEKAGCEECMQWALLYRFNFFNELDSLQPYPQIEPQTASLELHYLISLFLKNLKIGKELGPWEVRRIQELLKDERIPLLQKIDAADNLATSYFYPKENFDEALSLYSFALSSGSAAFTDFWKMQVMVPGVYKSPAAQIARCYMNSGLILLKKGDFPKAIAHFRHGGENFSVLGDTLGMLWSQATLGQAYGIMDDAPSAYEVLETSYQIVSSASKGMVGDVPTRFYHIFEPLLSNSFDPRTNGQFVNLLSKMSADAEVLGKSAPDGILYYLHLLVNERLLAKFWDMEPREFPMSSIDSLYQSASKDDYAMETYLSDLRDVLRAKYYLLKYSEAVPSRKKHYRTAFNRSFEQLGSSALQKEVYVVTDPMLRKMGDFELLLRHNARFIDFSGKETSPEAMDMAYSRYTSWYEMGRHDSALHYYQYYKNIEDSLVNAENYIELAKASVAIKTARAKQESAALKLANQQQRQFIVGIIWASLLVVAGLLFYGQKRRKDRQLAARDMELLNIKAQRAEEERRRMVQDYERVRNELRESVKQAMKEQSRNLELMEIVQELRTSKHGIEPVQSSNNIERKLKSYHADAVLTKLEQKAMEAYPRLYDYLRKNLSARNKAELIYCIMLVMEYESQEISRTLHRSEKALRSLRYRVRKKLNLLEDDDLMEHLKAMVEENRQGKS